MTIDTNDIKETTILS